MAGMGRVDVPGMRTPAVGFAQPFEMLEACHERMQRSLQLLQRLWEHVAVHGVDAQAQSAARDVLRYFDVASPLHHEDEELHVFPLLLASAEDSLLHARVRQLQLEHVRMTALWQQVRKPLCALAETPVGDCPRPHVFTLVESSLMDDFVQLYLRHMQHEDLEIYPAAQRRLPPAAVAPMGQEMAGRRGVRSAP